MAGETIRSEAICLDVRPWSRTSHVVTWLTPVGRVTTLVKGAVRPKSAFLGQYDLNYTCEILYYARARGEMHALRECSPTDLRESLRGDYRALALAGYARALANVLAPAGEECRPWYELLARFLSAAAFGVRELVGLELAVLRLSGMCPDFSAFDRKAEWLPFSLETGVIGASGGRSVRLSRDTAAFLADPTRPVKNMQTPLDAARVIGVFYQFQLDCASDVRRSVLGMISSTKQGESGK